MRGELTPALSRSHVMHGGRQKPQASRDGGLRLPMLDASVNLEHEFLGEDAVPAAVSILGGVVSPSNVARLVAAVAIDSIDREAGWSLAHISKEAREGHPSLTHGDAATSVVGVPRVLRVRAPRDHSRPCLVGPRVRRAVRDVSRAQRANPTLAASSRLATSKAVATHCGRLAALAAAKPSRASALSRSRSRLDNERTESKANHRNVRTHALFLLRRSDVVTRVGIGEA